MKHWHISLCIKTQAKRPTTVKSHEKQKKEGRKEGTYPTIIEVVPQASGSPHKTVVVARMSGPARMDEHRIQWVIGVGVLKRMDSEDSDQSHRPSFHRLLHSREMQPKGRGRERWATTHLRIANIRSHGQRAPEVDLLIDLPTGAAPRGAEALELDSEDDGGLVDGELLESAHFLLASCAVVLIVPFQRLHRRESIQGLGEGVCPHNLQAQVQQRIICVGACWTHRALHLRMHFAPCTPSPIQNPANPTCTQAHTLVNPMLQLQLQSLFTWLRNWPPNICWMRLGCCGEEDDDDDELCAPAPLTPLSPLPALVHELSNDSIK